MIGELIAQILIIFSFMIILKLIDPILKRIWAKMFNTIEKSQRLRENESLYIKTKGTASGVIPEIRKDKSYLMISSAMQWIFSAAIFIVLAMFMNIASKGVMFTGGFLRCIVLFFIIGFVAEAFWKRAG